MTPADFLLVDDDAAFCQVLTRALERRGFSVVAGQNPKTALQLLENYQPRFAVVDLKLAEYSGLALISALKQRLPSIEIVMLTGYSSIATAVEAVKLGATNYLCKPASTDEILMALAIGDNKRSVEVPELPPSIERLEWEHIQNVLQQCSGNISATARALGMHRRTLQRKLQKRPVRQ